MFTVRKDGTSAVVYECKKKVITSLLIHLETWTLYQIIQYNARNEMNLIKQLKELCLL